MKAENKTTDHNRTIRLVGSPLELGVDGELLITINYVQKPNDGNVIQKAITLDNIVIPKIIELINRG